MDPQIALRLTSRLFDEGSELPNARTAWRDVLGAVLCSGPGRKLPVPAASQFRDLAEATADWLRRPGSAVGVAGVCTALFKLLVCALPAAPPTGLTAILSHLPPEKAASSEWDKPPAAAGRGDGPSAAQYLADDSEPADMLTPRTPCGDCGIRP